MDQRLFYLAVAYMFISAGCVSTSKQCDSRCQLHTALTDVAKVKIPGGPTASNELADQAFRDLVGQCANVLNKLEVRSDKRRRRIFTLAIAGAIAGSVGAPAVIANEGSMALAAGLSGFSGAANTAQQLAGEQGYSRAELILARENIVTQLNTYVDQWLALEGLGEVGTAQGRAKINAKIGILQGMIVACSTYPLSPAQPSKQAEDLIDSVQAVTN